MSNQMWKRFDRDPAELKQVLEELNKLTEVRDADLPAKRNLVYLRTTGSMAEYVKQRLHFQSPGRSL